jgi:hypothetical protein
MAIRIQLRRDTAANWTSSNPVLRAGELGIETDTLKFKIGNGSSTWTQITNYANVTDAGLSNSLSSYILAEDQGTPGGPAELNSTGDLLVPENSIVLWDDSDYTYSTTVSATQPTANRTITLPDATGTVALAENVAALSGATFTGNINVPTAITFEGATADSYETTIQVTDPTADRTITIPDVGGTFVTTGDTGSVTNTMLAGSIANDKLSNSAITINGTSTSLGGSRTLGTDDVSEGTTNKYFTDERAQDAIATAIAAGTHTNITITYDDSTNKFTFVGANTYSDENAQDAVGNALGTGLSYNDTTGAISVDTTAIQAKVANVDDTEIGYLNGVTSGIQTQIDNKASLSGATFTGAVSGTSLTLSGDLTVNGTTTTLNSTTISVDDKNIELGSVATPSDATADGGGITLKGSTDKTFNWVDATDAWTSSEHVNLASGKSLYLNGTLLKDATETLTNKTLTSPKINEDVAVTATATELNVLDGITSTTAELNILDGVTSTAAEINILDGATLSTTELNYVDGVTSDIQTQLNGKSATGHTHAATDVTDFTETAQDAIGNSLGTGLSYNDSTGAISVDTATIQARVADVSDTEIGYLNGVTSAIQTQLDGKVDESLFDTKGDILVASADNTPAKLAAGTNGYLLTANSAAANGVEWAAAPVSLPTQTDNAGKYLTTDGSTASWGTLVVPITTGTSTVSANTATTIDTTALSAFTSIEYMVSLKQGSKIRTSKVVVQTDGTSVDMTEFAITETGGTIAGVVVSVAVSSTNAVLQLTATDAVTTNVTVKFSKVAL